MTYIKLLVELKASCDFIKSVRMGGMQPARSFPISGTNGERQGDHLI